MRASIFVGTSLDGFIAREDGSVDFLSHGDNEQHGFSEFLGSVDALVMGRTTYDFVIDFGTWPYGSKPVFVLSSSEIQSPPDGALVERMSGDPADITAELARRGIEHIYVDGGATIQRFLRAGLIDHLIITQVPVLIGSGIPLFGDLDADIILKHVTTRQFASGLVQNEYELAS